jgi:hypothetical protein
MPLKSDFPLRLRVNADSVPQLRIYDINDTNLGSVNFVLVSGDVYNLDIVLNAYLTETVDKEQKIRLSIFEDGDEVYKSDCLTLYNCGGYNYEISLVNGSNTEDSFWQAQFPSNLLVAGAGNFDGTSLPVGSSSVLCTVSKTSNFGVAEGAGTIRFTIGTTTVHTIDFVDMETVTNRSYTFTGVQSGSVLIVAIIGDGGGDGGGGIDPIE